jgi:bacillithiol synthase
VSEPRVLTQPLSGPALARLACQGRAPDAWYARAPRTPDEWRAHAARVRGGFSGDAWLDALRPAIEARGAAAERLERVSAGRGIVITTGQQPGLFGGPVYTWSKVVSVLALADELERATGVPTAPVFWAATYDADFAESSVSYVALGDAVEVLAMPPPEQPGLSMRDTPIGDVHPLVRTLERAMGSAADASVLETVLQSYTPEHTIGTAFVTLLRAILEPMGVAVLDAGHPAVRAAWRPLMMRALRDADAVDAGLRAREEELRAAGFEPKVAHVNGLSLVFEATPGWRRRIPISATRRAARDGVAELEPNVLLRPVAERALLPTAAYVAGPNEFTYFAQVSAVATALGLDPPLSVPRWSGLIIEPHIERILTRYGLAYEELRDPHAAEKRLVKERLPSAITAALERCRAALAEAAGDLAHAVSETTPPLLPDAVVQGARREIANRLDRLERRVLAAAKRRHAELMRDVATARASLFPLGKPQERLLNFMPMLARHGRPLLGAMRSRAGEHASRLVAVPASDEPMAQYDHVGDTR